MSDEILQVKVDLTGRHREWFLEIKRRHGFQTNTEVIRHMIFIAWDAEEKDNIFMVDLPRDVTEIIERYLRRKDVREKFLLNSLKDFVNSAVKTKIEEIRQSVKNVLHYEVRAKLSEEEREVALALQNCLRRSHTGGVTAREVAEELDRRNVKSVETILDQFVYRFLLDSLEEGNDKVYYISTY